MPYLDLRLTLEHLPQEIHLSVFFTELFNKIEPVKYILSFEEKNKYGEPCLEHIHINIEHCDYELKKDNLQKWINRNYGIKTNKMYCLRFHEELGSDEMRWWRYPLKQLASLNIGDTLEATITSNNQSDYKKLQNHNWMTKGFSDVELENMRVVANDEWGQRTKENKEVRTKLENKNSFRHKLVKNLKEKNKVQKLILDYEIAKAIYDFYNSNSMTTPFKKLDELVIDMKLELGFLTFKQYWESKHT